MMRDLWNVLPDDRPITAICLVENPNKKPAGYQIVDRTYDQDTDADLWREGFFGKKITRYLCHSKSSSPTVAIVDSLTVINDKENPPEGFTALTHTSDSDQKATKKRTLCYRCLPREKATQAITDLIVLGKSKRAPSGFTLAGDMNGQLICFKATPVPKETKSSLQPTTASPARNSVASSSAPNSNSSLSSASIHNLPYPVSATEVQPPPLYPTEQLQSVSNALPQLSRHMTLPKNLEYGRSRQSRSHYASSNIINPPVPVPRTNKSRAATQPANAPSVLDGVVFEISSKFKTMKDLTNFVIPNLDKKTAEDIDAEYNYNFNLERQILRRSI
ncbi:hypothetical protein CHUAL_009971 [Chamberlinius hualienensis]